MRSVRLTPDFNAWLENEAAAYRMTVSAYIRHVLSAHARQVNLFFDGDADRPPTLPDSYNTQA
jgi:hypothetical protein